ncbi:MAG: hypothetical protein SFU56_02710 [Capsulimonadales bacterium]|nr:hypothetical protein [Capsulimonadales bacterium]
MKKEVNPIVIVVALVAVVGVVAVLYFRGTATPPPVEADPLGINDSRPGRPKEPKDRGADGPGGVTPDIQYIREQQRKQQGQ